MQQFESGPESTRPTAYDVYLFSVVFSGKEHFRLLIEYKHCTRIGSPYGQFLVVLHGAGAHHLVEISFADRA